MLFLFLSEENCREGLEEANIIKNEATSLGDVVQFFSIFSFGGHFVQRSGTILAILVEGHPKSISAKLF